MMSYKGLILCRQIASHWCQRRRRQHGARKDAICAEKAEKATFMYRQIASHEGRRQRRKHDARNDTVYAETEYQSRHCEWRDFYCDESWRTKQSVRKNRNFYV